MNNRISIPAGTLTLLAMLALGACTPLGDTGGGSGGNGSGGSAPGGSGGANGNGSGGASGAAGATSAKATFANVTEIVAVQCGGSGCHGGETMPLLVGLDATKLYTALTTYKSKRCGNFFLVKPGAPQESAFYLAQKGGLCKDADTTKKPLDQMPFGCSDGCTPDDYLEGVRQWIANGAKTP